MKELMEAVDVYIYVLIIHIRSLILIFILTREQRNHYRTVSTEDQFGLLIIWDTRFSVICRPVSIQAAKATLNSPSSGLGSASSLRRDKGSPSSRSSSVASLKPGLCRNIVRRI